MGSFELGAEAAAAVLLSLIEWAEVEVQGFDDLIEGPRRLRGAVMTAGIEAAETIRGNSTDW